MESVPVAMGAAKGSMEALSAYGYTAPSKSLSSAAFDQSASILRINASSLERLPENRLGRATAAPTRPANSAIRKAKWTDFIGAAFVKYLHDFLVLGP